MLKKRSWSNCLYLLLVLSGMTVSCKTVYEKVNAPPEWTVVPPVSDDQVWYFQAEAVTQDEEASRYAAVDVLYHDILASIGLTQEELDKLPDSSRAFFQDLRKDLVMATLHPAVSKFPGYSALDRAVFFEESGNVHVYYLSAFSREGISQLKRRVSTHYRFYESGVSELEKKAEKLVSSGETYAAMLVYMEAAFLGLENGGDIADLLFTRNIQTAEELLGRMQLEKGETPVSVMGQEYTNPFMAAVRDQVSLKGQAGVALLAVFREQDRNGGVRYRTARVVTSRDGQMNFFPPAPNFYGAATITVGFSDSFIPDDPAYPFYVKSVLDRMRATIRNRSISYEYTILFDPKKIHTGILVLDTDIVKKPLKSPVTEKNLEQEMLQAGYTVSVMDLNPDVLLKKKEPELVRDLRTVYSGKYERVIFGVSSVTGFKNENGLSVAEVTATFSVLDLKKGTILFSRTIVKTATARDSQQALSSAFLLAGKSFVQFYLTQP